MQILLAILISLALAFGGALALTALTWLFYVPDSMDLQKLNSITKYPSIPTYHVMEKGKLQPEISLQWPNEPVIATEKIDGTNARIILTGNDYFIGSRGHILYAKGDRAGDSTLGIVEGVKNIAESLVRSYAWTGLTVIYGEFYGGKASSASKQYTGHQNTGFRVFDAANITPDTVKTLMGLSAESISMWRQTTGPNWHTEAFLKSMADSHGLTLTPRLGEVELPKTFEEANTILKFILPWTKAALDGNAQGKPEGIVIRTANRSHIAKLRSQDYKRALKAAANDRD